MVELRVRIIRILNQRKNFQINVWMRRQTGHRWQTDYGWLPKAQLVRAVAGVAALVFTVFGISKFLKNRKEEN